MAWKRTEATLKKKSNWHEILIYQSSLRNNLDYDFFRLLGYYAAWSCLKPTFRDYLSFPSAGVKMDILTIETGTDRKSRNVGFQPTHAA
jgi:hypothetical protein